MNKIKNKYNFGHLFVVFLTSFLLGIIFSFNIGNKSNNELLKTTNNVINNTFSYKTNLDLNKFFEIYKLIKINDYNSETIKKSDLEEGAIKGLVEGLGDKHSQYFNIKDTKKFNDMLSGDFEGIGAVVEINELGVKIERLIKGSPAIKYGLKSGDIIINANGDSLEGLGLYDAVDKIKGPAGTSVDLKIIRVGEKNILDIKVTRDKIKIPSVDSKTFSNGDIGYISINMFGEDTSKEFEKSLNKLMNTKGIIIDLRDNGGGYLQSAVSILSKLVEDDKILVTTKYKDTFNNISYPSINDGNIYKGKIVILINENTASASEITSGALKDYKKAILVGTKSYGKGSVQKPFDLDDGSMLKLTIAKWFTPNDVNIDKKGILPDIEVNFEKKDYTPEVGKEKDFKPYDRQLEVAKEVLNEFINIDVYKLSIDKYLEKNEKYRPKIKK